MVDRTRRVLSVGLGVVALGGRALAQHMTPTVFLDATREEPVNLERSIPLEIGPWRCLPTAVGEIVNPVQQMTLARIYAQLVSRVYLADGRASMMMSVAYGRDQRSDLAAHYPDVCYPAQGFEVIASGRDLVRLPDGSRLSVKQLSTVGPGSRYESVSYWTTIGEYRVINSFERRVMELKYGLAGVIPDGLLFRISSIGEDKSSQFRAHRDFIVALWKSLDGMNRALLLGKESV